MEILFLTIVLFCIACVALGIGGSLLWVVEHITWKHMIITGSLLSTLGMLAATCYALWTAFGWWCLAYLSFATAHGLFTSWLVFNFDKPSLNQPVYRVGGGHASPRLHR